MCLAHRVAAEVNILLYKLSLFRVGCLKITVIGACGSQRGCFVFVVFVFCYYAEIAIVTVV